MRLRSMEEIMRSPRRGDALIPSPAALERYQGLPADAYAHGYRIAAEVLSEHARKGPGEETFLFYPIIFLYRHHVELMLKNLIVTFNEPGLRSITGSQELGAEHLGNLRTHSLQALWDRLRPMVCALGDRVIRSEIIEGISFYIQQLNEIDPQSVNFRYATKAAETKGILGKAQKDGSVGLQEFAEGMDRLAGILGGIDTYVSEIIHHHNEVSAEAYDSGY